ncbi:unnamed protein product, partial [Candidula unifasciata]
INSLAANTIEDILKKPLHKLHETTLTLITKCLVFLYGILIIGLAYGASSLQGSVSQMVASITGPWAGTVLGIFLLGAIVPWANKYGAICGGVIALLFSMWIAIGNQMYGGKAATVSPPPTDMCFQNSSLGQFTVDGMLQTNFYNITFFHSDLGNKSVIGHSSQKRQQSTERFFPYDISNEWFALIGCTITLVVGTVISFFTRKCALSVTDQKYLFPFIRISSASKTPDTKCEANHEGGNEMAHLMSPAIKSKILI